MERLLAIREAILSAMTPVAAEEVTLSAALGRYLAADAIATQDVPAHACSAMDGWAVRASDVPGPVTLPSGFIVYAGDVPPRPLAAGEAARIFTGATLPPGADAVVREEAARQDGAGVRFLGPARSGENVRRAGEDVVRGARALVAGTRVGARQSALLRAVGAERVAARRVPRVAVVSTGDEILSGRTPDSNGVALAGLVAVLGASPLRSVVGDRVEDLEVALGRALAGADAVVTIAGVSVGERDLVPAALARVGADVRVHGVPMKPGKPFLFAVARGRPVFGLPGSPSACLAAFEVFARPALLALAGAARRERPSLPLRLAEPVDGRPGRARLLWARVEPGGTVRPVGRDVAQIRGPALADALVVLPSGTGDLAAGAEVTAWLLEEDAPSWASGP